MSTTRIAILTLSIAYLFVIAVLGSVLLIGALL